MKDREIIDLLSKDKVCNFIGIAVTPWHAHGIDAAIMRLEQEGISLHGYIFAISFVDGTRTVKENNFTIKNPNIKILECSFEKKTLFDKLFLNFFASYNERKNRTKANIFYVVRPMYPDFGWINLLNKAKRDYKVCFIATDEGIGTYTVSEKENWLKGIADTFEKRHGIGYASKMLAYSILADYRLSFRRKMEKRLADRDCFKEWYLLTRRDGKLIPDSIMANYYRKVFNAYEIPDLSDGVVTMYEDAVIISAPVSSEEGANVGDADLVLFGKTIELLKKYSLKTIIKIHPREKDVSRYEQFGVPISNYSNFSMELIVRRCKTLPKAVIGIESTPLITLKTIYGIPSIGLAKMFIEMIDDEISIGSLKALINTFGSLIKFPNSAEELEGCIREELKAD